MQRCLVHYPKNVQIWLSAYPKTKEDFDLREIIRKLNFINNETKSIFGLKKFWIGI